ncbi:hypothetical protein Cgig2_030891 [Carnegiea gigantea]|uniref:Uncharacterized protein n=1 Tax=Carnegiea gigantea TaxID=171969 RepID=A0A9Q1GTN9_9CARY|nr:hypothetical protein Cgig2_030891 [Carnegiea gigantea]
MDQVNHVLLVAEDILVLNVQLVEMVENRLKHRGTRGSRSGSRNSARWARVGADRSASSSTWTLRDVLDIIITTIITNHIRFAPKLTIHVIIINQVRGLINASRLVQDAQSGNLGAIAQNFCQSCDDTTIANNHLSGFIVLIEVVGYEGTNIDGLSIQCRPKHEELTGSNPILAISSGKYMVCSEALKVMKHRITDPRSIGGSCLVPTPWTCKGTPKVLRVILRMCRGGGPRRWQLQQLIEPYKVHFMGLVKQSKADISSNFIKFTVEAHDRASHRAYLRALTHGCASLLHDRASTDCWHASKKFQFSLQEAPKHAPLPLFHPVLGP